jgi:hypothetical protein
VPTPERGGRLLTLPEISNLGKALYLSKYFKDLESAAQAVVKILAGQELGFGPLASLAGVYVVKGKVALSANLMAALIRRDTSPYDYRIVALTDDRCELEFVRRGEVLGRSVFTMEDAKKAGLAGGENWRKYPRNMLFSRALSNGFKWFTPDLSGGPLYVPDELGATTDAEGHIVPPAARDHHPETAAEPITPEQMGHLEAEVLRVGADAAALCRQFDVRDLSDLTAAQYRRALTFFDHPNTSEDTNASV